VTFQIHWLPTNASWLDQIEIWFSILQRKLLHVRAHDIVGTSLIEGGLTTSWASVEILSLAIELLPQ